MKRYLLPVVAMAVGLTGGLVLLKLTRGGETVKPVGKTEMQVVPKGRSQAGTFRAFVEGRIPGPEGPRVAWYPEERRRQREEIKSPFRTSAVLGQAIEDLSADEMVEMLKNRAFPSVEEMSRVFARLAEIDPIWAMEVRRETRQSVQEMDESIKAVYGVWVRKDVAKALDWSYNLPSSGERQANSLFLTQKWLEVDPHGVAENFDKLQHARGFGSFSAGFENQLMRAWLGKDEEAAAAWVEGLPEGEKKVKLRNALEEEMGKKQEL